MASGMTFWQQFPVKIDIAELQHAVERYDEFVVHGICLLNVSGAKLQKIIGNREGNNVIYQEIISPYNRDSLHFSKISCVCSKKNKENKEIYVAKLLSYK